MVVMMARASRVSVVQAYVLIGGEIVGVEDWVR